jgi:hypothetical protein
MPGAAVSAQAEDAAMIEMEAVRASCLATLKPTPCIERNSFFHEAGSAAFVFVSRHNGRLG